MMPVRWLLFSSNRLPHECMWVTVGDKLHHKARCAKRANAGAQHKGTDLNLVSLVRPSGIVDVN